MSHSCAGLERLPGLNTLVVKQNAISDLGACLAACSGLQKLSAAHNALTSLGGCLAGCTQLKELRLNHNRIAALPADLAANAQLRILDLGDNPIASVTALKVLDRTSPAWAAPQRVARSCTEAHCPSAVGERCGCLKVPLLGWAVDEAPRHLQCQGARLAVGIHAANVNYRC